MKILSTLAQRWNAYWDNRHEEVIRKIEAEELRRKEADIAFRLEAEKNVITDAIKSMKLDRFQYKINCRTEDSKAFFSNFDQHAGEYHFVFPYCAFITLESVDDLKQLLAEQKPERLYVIAYTGGHNGFYEEQTFGRVYIRLSEFAFIDTKEFEVVLDNASNYPVRGIFDIFPYVAEETFDVIFSKRRIIYKRIE